MEHTTRNVKQVYSTVEALVYKAPVRQRDMVVSKIAPGRLYDYLGKDINSAGIFYRIKQGYIFVDSNVHIK